MKVAILFTLAWCALAVNGASVAEEPKSEPAAKPASTSTSAPTAAPAAAPAPEASIPFADHNGIYTWQVENSRSLLIQSQSKKWYRATLMSSCFDLPFAEQVAFETNPNGSFDKFSAIRVRSQRCPVTSLVETTAPAKKVKKVKSPPKVTPEAMTH